MLGHGEDTEERDPRVVEALLGKDIRKVACGASHTIALSSKLPALQYVQHKMYNPSHSSLDFTFI